ncbi:MAG: calcium-binding protein [Gaiellaceae bacterium]
MQKGTNMRNLRFTKGKVGLRRLAALSVAAAGVAVATAAVYPAQGAAARHRHHIVRAHVRLEHHALRVDGTRANDAIALRLAAGNPTVVQVDLGDNGSADFSFPRAAIASISIEGHGGNDRLRIDDMNGAFTDTIPTRIDGGPGNDTIAGGAGRETLQGGPGNDRIDGNGGNDVSDLGPGDDIFVWDPGDGSDTIEGGPGTDAMVFNGAAASETVDLSANGNRLRFFRSPANITMDTHGVEQVDFNALGGADTVTVNDLSRTDVKNVDVDLAGALGGATGDGQTDRVLVTGTPLNDAIAAAGDASGVTVSGLETQVAIQHQEPTDQLFVLGLGGDDAISATGLGAGAISEFLEGGDGNDTIAGGPGAETLLGGNGNDTIDGNGGNDHAALGAGDDTFVWDPGDGSDTIEGEDGRDALVFNGAAASETVDLSANGDRLRFFRQPANITMDTGGVEFVTFNALGGADNVTVNDLTGTDVTSVDLNLTGTLGGTTGDGQTDRVVVNGTAGDDAATVAGGAGDVSVTGLAPTLELLHAEATDQLDFENFAVGDTVASGGLAAGTIQLFLDGILVP